MAQRAPAQTTQFLELIERRKGIDRAVTRAAEDDLACDGVHGLRRRFDHGTGGDVALGNPRPLVEQARGAIERFHVDLDERGAQAHETGERRLVGLRRVRVAEELALAGHGHAEAHARGHGAERAQRTQP